MRYLSSLTGHDEENDDVAAATPEQILSPLESATREELTEMLLEGLQQAHRRERERGITLVGPHRDDLHFTLDSTPVKGYASHGETWSFALALRLGSYRVMLEDDPTEGSEPILILDDVFAELDARRRRRLADLATGAEQLIVTAAVDDDVPQQLLAHASQVSSHDQVSTIAQLSEDSSS